MPIKNLAKLFVAVHEPGGARLDGLRGRVATELNKRIGEMELSPPVASVGATSAGVRASLVDRLSSIKEDVETLDLLAKDLSSLTKPHEKELAAAIAKAISKTIVKLTQVMLQGTEERSPRIISKAVGLARLAHTTLLKLNPQAPADLQAFMTDALLTPELKPQVNDAELVFCGKYLYKLVVKSDGGNHVSAAAKRQIDGTDTEKNREAVDVQLFRRALAYAFKPAWSEPQGEGLTTTHSLFGDGWAWPTPEVGSLKAELVREKKYIEEKDSTRINGLLTFLEGFHNIKNAGQMTQQEAERQVARLQALMLEHELGEPLGSDNIAYRWDVARLTGLGPRARVAELHKMLEPAHIQAQRQIVTQVNSQRAIVRIKKKVDADSKKVQDKRRVAGDRLDTSAAQQKIAAYEAQKAAKAAAEAAEAAQKAANTGNPVNSDSQ